MNGATPSTNLAMVKAPVPKPIKNTGSPGTEENRFRVCKNWNSFTIVRACKSVLREREDFETEEISRQMKGFKITI